jgi:hypothetical protein
MAEPIKQDQADRAYNQIVSKNSGIPGKATIIKYAQLRNDEIIELNPLCPCYFGEIHPVGDQQAPMSVNVVKAWLDSNQNVLWQRPIALPPSRKSRLPSPPPPPPRRKDVSEDHTIYTKIAEGKATTEDFNQLIQEATPESVRDRVRRRMKTNATDSHQDGLGHQQLNLPNFNDRVQPKRKPSNRSQMHGRGRVAHRHSAKTQEKTMPKRFAEAVEFIREHIGKSDYDNALQLIEDKRALNVVATKFMALPNIDRDWLSKLIIKST